MDVNNNSTNPPDCPMCFNPIPPTAAFCPSCGARMKALADSLDAPEAADPTYLPLAHANLRRLRGDWKAAQDAVVEVLRQFPNSATGHSLLGDIYSDQQLYQEAVQWYQMALDLDPDNQADSRKLQVAQARLDARNAPPEVPAAPVSRFSALRVIALAGTLVLAGIIGVGFWFKQGSAPIPEPARPTTSTRAPATAPEKPVEQVRNPAPAVQILQTPREANLAHILSKSIDIHWRGLALSQVQIDERQQITVLTLNASAIPWSQSTLEDISSGAFYATRIALQSDTALKGAAARVLMPVTSASGTTVEQVFRGALDRPQADTPPLQWTDQWWKPGLTQATANTANTP